MLDSYKDVSQTYIHVTFLHYRCHIITYMSHSYITGVTLLHTDVRLLHNEVTYLQTNKRFLHIIYVTFNIHMLYSYLEIAHSLKDVTFIYNDVISSYIEIPHS